MRGAHLRGDHRSPIPHTVHSAKVGAKGPLKATRRVVKVAAGGTDARGRSMNRRAGGSGTMAQARGERTATSRRGSGHTSGRASGTWHVACGAEAEVR